MIYNFFREKIMSEHQKQTPTTTTSDVTPAISNEEGTSTFSSATVSEDGLKIRILRNRKIHQSEETRKTVVPPTTSPAIKVEDEVVPPTTSPVIKVADDEG